MLGLKTAPRSSVGGVPPLLCSGPHPGSPCNWKDLWARVPPPGPPRRKRRGNRSPGHVRVGPAGGGERGGQAPCVQAFLPPLTFGETQAVSYVRGCLPGEGGSSHPTARGLGAARAGPWALGRPVGRALHAAREGALERPCTEPRGPGGGTEPGTEKAGVTRLRARTAAPQEPPSPCHPHLHVTPPSAAGVSGPPPPSSLPAKHQPETFP